MKFLSIFLLFYYAGFSQVENHYEKYSAYLFYRSTENKINIIAKDFNLSDTLMTHVGLGILFDKEILIYNVNYVDNGNALSVDTFDEFLNIYDIRAFSVWKLNITKNQYKKLKKNLLEIKSKYYVFDFDFSLSNNEYYCSEFVYDILRNSNILSKKINFSKNLNQFYSKALKRDTLMYIPIDSFQELENINCIEHKIFK